MDRVSKKRDIFSSLEEILSEFVIDLDEKEELKAKEHLSAVLEVSFDSRQKGGEISKGKLDCLAEQLMIGDTFTIITRKGKKFTHDELRLSNSVSLPCDGSSVSKEAAWNELEGYFKRLKGQGILEL